MDVVLDSLGVPYDNTLEQIDKYGEVEAYKHPGTFCRDWYTFKYDEMVKEGIDEEIGAYLHTVKDALSEE